MGMGEGRDKSRMASVLGSPCRLSGTNLKDYFFKYLLVVLFDLDEVLVRIVRSHPCLAHVVADLCIVVSPMNGYTECPLKIKNIR